MANFRLMEIQPYSTNERLRWLQSPGYSDRRLKPLFPERAVEVPHSCRYCGKGRWITLNRQMDYRPRLELVAWTESSVCFGTTPSKKCFRQVDPYALSTPGREDIRRFFSMPWYSRGFRTSTILTLFLSCEAVAQTAWQKSRNVWFDRQEWKSPQHRKVVSSASF